MNTGDTGFIEDTRLSRNTRDIRFTGNMGLNTGVSTDAGSTRGTIHNGFTGNIWFTRGITSICRYHTLDS